RPQHDPFEGDGRRGRGRRRRMTSPLRLYDAGEMRAVDRRAIEDIGIPGVVLMERAGVAAAEAILALGGRSAAVICGGGNNGGDGYVVARHLLSAGWEVECLLAADPAGLPA